MILKIPTLRLSDCYKQNECVHVNIYSHDEALIYVQKMLILKEGFAFATLNLDHVVKLYENKLFLDAYRKHEAISADGFPIVLIGRILNLKLSRATGSDLFLPLISIAHQMNISIALIGTKDQVLASASRRLKEMFPGLKVALKESPSFGFNPDSEEASLLLNRIKASGAGLCFLAFGAPKQEILAALGRELAPQVGFLSVGASIDFVAGSQRRAPFWVRRLYLEWLWRLVGNPRRLIMRYLLCAVIFPLLVLQAFRQRLLFKK